MSTNETVATRRHVPKEYLAFYLAAQTQGWVVTLTRKSNHLRWRSPEGSSIFTPKTPSTNGPAINRIATKLRNGGLNL